MKRDKRKLVQEMIEECAPRIFANGSMELSVPYEVHVDHKGDRLIYGPTTVSPTRRTARVETLTEFLAMKSSQRLIPVTEPDTVLPQPTYWIEESRKFEGNESPVRVGVPAIPDPAGSLKIGEFVRNWGAFGICNQHGLPISHSEFYGAGVFGITCSQEKARIEGREYFVEPLAFWRRTLERISAIYHIGTELALGGTEDALGGLGSKEDWLLLDPVFVLDPQNLTGGQGDREPWLDDRPWSPNVYGPHARIASEIQDMIGIANLRPHLYWQSSSPKNGEWSFDTLGLGGGLWPLFSWITFRLITDLIVAKGTMVKCPYCNHAYKVNRRPGAGQGNFCKNPECIKRYFREYQRGIAADKRRIAHELESELGRAPTMDEISQRRRAQKKAKKNNG